MAHKILHFIDTLGAGGAERQLVYLLANLDRKRYESHIVTTYDVFRHYEYELKQLDIPIYSLDHGELRISNRFRAIGRYTRLMWSLQPEIVHSWLHYPNLIARLTRPICPSHKLITAVRTEYSPRQQRSESITSKLSDFRIVINEGKTFEQKENSQRSIPNAVDLDKFSPLHSQSAIQLKTSFTLLMVARIDERKDHQTLLKALSLLKAELPEGFRTILIGEITSLQTQKQLESAIAEYQLNNLVVQLPASNNIEEQYHVADVTILPSVTEGFPNVVLESFASGKPIIISESANTVGLVKHGNNGWIFPTGDSTMLASCIRTAYQASDSERLHMGERGRVVAEKYSIPKMANKYTQLYERALHSS